MREILVAVFDTEPNTDRAVQALEAADIPHIAIRRYRKDDPAAPQLTTTERATTNRANQAHETSGGFWAWLLGEEGTTNNEYHGTYETDHTAYGRAIEAGSTVLAVTVEQAYSDRMMNLLAEQLPLQLEDVGVERGSEQAQPERTVQAQSQSGVQSIGTAPRDREEVIPLAKEQVDIGTRQVDQGATRIRRYVVEQPVERQVNLRDEHVEVERRRPVTGGVAGEDAFQERVVEVRDTREEPVVTKTAAVDEEVVVRRETTTRPETVRTTERKEQVDIDKAK